jgi:hypothetical protein
MLLRFGYMELALMAVFKPEGNLFRDRMLSMQQRALVEPRAIVVSVPSTLF